MILIIGLGNPGKKYEKTRHNAGFMAVDEITANFQFPIFNFQSIFNAQISKGEIAGKKIILVKPQTFVNLSGVAVKSLYTKYPEGVASRPYGAGKIQNTKHIIVIHDDIDISLGKIRISESRGAAGHKGVESIICELKTKDFTRFRVGIQPKTGKPKNPENFVLQKFNKKEEETIKEVIKKTAEAVEFSLKEGLEKTMSKYNC